MLLCLQLLNTHLSLALTGGMTQTVLGSEAAPLRQLLFRWAVADVLCEILRRNKIKISCGKGTYIQFVGNLLHDSLFIITYFVNILFDNFQI